MIILKESFNKYDVLSFILFVYIYIYIYMYVYLFVSSAECSIFKAFIFGVQEIF